MGVAVFQGRPGGPGVVRTMLAGVSSMLAFRHGCLCRALSAEIRPPPRGLTPPWYPPRGKDVRIQGVSVRATRKP